MAKRSLASYLPKNTTARHLGSFPSGSPEWHALRSLGIGGSDVGAICGLNKWESPMSLWAKRAGMVTEERTTSEAMEWGNRLESVIIAKFREVHPSLDVLEQPGTFCHQDREWQIANPDALALNPTTGEQILVEVKTARYEDEWDEETNTIPPSYRAQVLWYLQTLGLTKAIVVVLFSGSRYREFQVEFDAFEADANLHRVTTWMKYLKDGTMPDFDGAESTYNSVRAMHPDIDQAMDDVELGDLGMHYFVAQAEFETADEKFRQLKSEVLSAMGRAKRGLVFGEWRITRQARGNGLPYLVNRKA